MPTDAQSVRRPHYRTPTLPVRPTLRISIRPSCKTRPRPASPHSSDLRNEFGKTATLILVGRQTPCVLDRLNIEGLSALVTRKPATNYLNFSLPLAHGRVQAEGHSTSDKRRRFLGPILRPRPLPDEFSRLSHAGCPRSGTALSWSLSPIFIRGGY